MSKKYFSVSNCGNYIYDSLTNQIITKPLIEKHNDFVDEKEDIESLNEIIWGIGEREFIHKYHTQLKTLVLQVTQDCNLRCKYCAYSGEFSHMNPHSKEKMSYAIAVKSVNFFMEHSSKEDCLTIIFYGGEPLLEFELIAKIVDYVNSLNRKTQFGISTNGTLLTFDFMEWVNHNPNVNVTITINGEKHDHFRVNSNGNGTLNSILEKLDFIKINYPTIWRNQIRIISNYYSFEEIIPLRDFFLNRLQKVPIAITDICLDNASSKLCSLFTLDEIHERISKNELIDMYINQMDPFLEKLFEVGLDKVINRGQCTSDTPGYIDSCVPLIWRLFIRSDGSINLCEKVTDNLCLGDISRGFDDDKILKLYYGLKDFCERNCKDCWAQRLCMFCYQDIVDENGEVIEHFSEKRCRISKLHSLDYLKMYIRLVNKYSDFD